MFKVRIVQRGPFWDQDEYDETLNDLGTDVRTELAAVGLAGVMAKLASPWPSGIRDRTPVLEGLLNVEESPHRSRVNYDGTEYGHWIEGTGRKNRPRPGFPGYHAFETAYGQVVAESPDVIERAKRRAIDRLNGV